MADNKLTKLRVGRAVGAMLGAACGDALGWPNERIGKSKAPKEPQGPLKEFRSWIRRTGGRFFPHEETIEAGEYSDDTQLILCLSRSFPAAYAVGCQRTWGGSRRNIKRRNLVCIRTSGAVHPRRCAGRDCRRRNDLLHHIQAFRDFVYQSAGRSVNSGRRIGAAASVYDESGVRHLENSASVL